MHDQTKTAMHHQSEMEHDDSSRLVTRRDVLATSGALVLGLAGPAAGQPVLAAEGSRASTSATPPLIRLASVTTIKDGGLLQDLLPPFETETGHRVHVYIGDDVYTQARAGKADVVFSHFGHKDTQAFVMQGLGQWPRTVLFNSIALIVPTHDPARVAGLSDPVAAFRRIASTRSPFVVNHVDGLRYLADTLWYAAGRPDKTGWYLDTGLKEDAAMQAAATHGGYSLWGVTPFLVSQQRSRRPLRPVLYWDELFHRIMVSIVVNPAAFPRANVTGASAFQQYLLAPATQARIRDFRYPGVAQPLFWPAGRNNAPALLPQGNGQSVHTHMHG